MLASTPPPTDNGLTQERRPAILVLSRRELESIKIITETGLEIDILVAEFRGDMNEFGDAPKVRLGFTAPDEIKIYRSEVWDRRKEKEGSGAA